MTRAWADAACLVALLLALVGCRHASYRWDATRNEPLVDGAVALDRRAGCSEAPPLPGRDRAQGGHIERCADDTGELFRVGYVEVDDQGRAWGSAQLARVLDDLRAARPDAGAVVVVYVHGWEHDAARDDHNVRNFRRVLYRRALVERARGSGKAVLGVFLGWRARPFVSPWPLTFWARKKGAHRVGERGGALALDAIDLELRTWRAQERARDGVARSRSLLVGHSFGAAVVHAAIHRPLERELIAAARAPHIPPPTVAFDLVALINPALEAPPFEPLYALGQRASAAARPRVLVATTAADCNTAVQFTLGMNGVRGNGVFRGDAERRYQQAHRHTAIGHYPWPSRLGNDAIVCQSRAKPGPGADTRVTLDAFDPATSRATYQAGRKRKHWVQFCRVEIRAHDDVCTFVPDGPVRPVTVLYDEAGELMDYHSHIFSDSLWTMLWGLLDGPP